MINVCVVEVEGSEYQGTCFVLVAADVDAALKELKAQHAKFKDAVHWHELVSVDDTKSVLDADFDHVPAYFNEHTAHFIFSICPVAGSKS